MGKELHRHLVVLAVGGIDVDGHRAAAKLADQRCVAVRCGGWIVDAFVAQTPFTQAPNAHSQQGIRNQAAFGEPQQTAGGMIGRQLHGMGIDAHRSSLGNHGNSIGVVRW